MTIDLSNERILDTDVNAWLDRYYGAVLDFSIGIATKRWDDASAPGTRITPLYYAKQDIGQKVAIKYGGGDRARCSEFTSWAIRKTGLGTPEGSVNTGSMKDYFSPRGRYYTRAQVEAGAYQLREGDYMSISSGDHSVLFADWRSLTGSAPATGDTYRTVEGNICNSVRTRTRTWDNTVQFVGSAQ